MSYNHEVLCPIELKKNLPKIAARVLDLQQKLCFDCIVSTGISGNGRSFVVSYLTGIPIAVVRKEGEQCHGDRVESRLRYQQGTIKYLILDDFIAGGDTLRRVFDKIKEEPMLGVWHYVGTLLAARWTDEGVWRPWQDKLKPLLELGEIYTMLERNRP